MLPGGSQLATGSAVGATAREKERKARGRSTGSGGRWKKGLPAGPAGQWLWGANPLVRDRKRRARGGVGQRAVGPGCSAGKAQVGFWVFLFFSSSLYFLSLFLFF